MTMDDKPRNGLAGLKHWRYDLAAGAQVALVSLSLGIAVASGAPHRDRTIASSPKSRSGCARCWRTG